jgi:hypothetical protein
MRIGSMSRSCVPPEMILHVDEDECNVRYRREGVLVQLLSSLFQRVSCLFVEKLVLHE